MKVRYPDYSNSIVNISCSILKYFNAKDVKHDSLKCLDDMFAQRKPRNVAFLLFDAMGISILERYLPEDSFTRRHLVRSLTSTFPPTTVAATTAVNTGLTPIETAWLGWITYFKEVDANVLTFMNTLQGTKTPACDHSLAYSVMPYKSLSMQILEVNPDVTCRAISPFPVNVTDKTVISKSIEQSCNTIADLCAEEGRHFIYSYWDDPDYSMHEYGVDDIEHISPILKEIDRNLEALSKKLGDDTIALVTADHSQINSKWFYLSDYPDLYDMVLRKHTIETRASSYFVKPGMKDAFAKRFKECFGDHFILMTHDEFLSSGLLGSGVPHPRTDGFVGDFIAIATDEYCLEDEHTDFVLKGIHAGLTEEEMMVPLIVL